MPADQDTATALALVVTSALDKAIAPLLERLRLVEHLVTHQSTETKAAVATVAGELGGLRERIAVAEAMPGIPGPPGRDGADGAPGRDGAAGAPGVPGLRYRGVYQDGETYTHGDVVTSAGCAWFCHATATAKPGAGSPACWQLMVKCGRDGRDVKDRS